jgi:hypothetical protein
MGIKWKYESSGGFSYWRWPLYVAVYAPIAIAVTGLVAFLVWWFGGFSEFHNDAPVAVRNDNGREVFNMPDQFPNLTSVCIHGNLVIETTRSDNQFFEMHVVENSPTCAE